MTNQTKSAEEHLRKKNNAYSPSIPPHCRPITQPSSRQRSLLALIVQQLIIEHRRPDGTRAPRPSLGVRLRIQRTDRSSARHSSRRHRRRANTTRSRAATNRRSSKQARHVVATAVGERRVPLLALGAHALSRQSRLARLAAFVMFLLQDFYSLCAINHR